MSLKVSMITARAGTAKHNDRTFDYLKESHIDPSRVKDNIYMSYKNLPFTEAEKAYYKDHYSGWLNTQNKKYREKGKRDKIRSTAKLLSRNAVPAVFQKTERQKQKCPDWMLFPVLDPALF